MTTKGFLITQSKEAKIEERKPEVSDSLKLEKTEQGVATDIFRFPSRSSYIIASNNRC